MKQNHDSQHVPYGVKVHKWRDAWKKRAGKTKTTENSLLMTLEKVPLRDFLQDVDAPEGYAYRWEGKACAQIHIFNDQYTLFWLGTGKGKDLAGLFFKMMDAANQRLISSGVEKGREWSVRTTCFYRTLIGGQTKFRNAELRLDQLVPDPHLLTSLERFVELYREETAAHYLSSSLLPYGRWHITLWGDSSISGAPHKEVGVTSNLPINPDLFEELFRISSEMAKSIPGYELQDFFANEAYPHTLRFFQK